MRFLTSSSSAFSAVAAAAAAPGSAASADADAVTVTGVCAMAGPKKPSQSAAARGGEITTFHPARVPF